MEKTRLEDGMKDELSRLESTDQEFLAKVDQFLEEQSLARTQAPENSKTKIPTKPREIGFIWRAFDDKVLTNMALGLMSASTIGLPFLIYYVLKSLGATHEHGNPLGVITTLLSLIGLLAINSTIWSADWPTNLLTNIFRGLRYRHYLKVAKTFPEATLYDIIALNGSSIAEEYPDCSVVRLTSGQFLRLKPIYAKIFSGKTSLKLEYILDYMKNIIRVKDSLKGIPNA